METLLETESFIKIEYDSEKFAFNPHLPSEPVHPYQLDESISNFRGVWCTFSSSFF